MANEENLKPCKPGETHNPNGRPKGAKNYKTRLKELLAAISDDTTWTSPLAAEQIKIIFSKIKIGTDKDGKDVMEYRYPVQVRQKAIGDALNRIDGMPVQKNINENDIDFKNLPDININIIPTKKDNKK